MQRRIIMLGLSRELWFFARAGGRGWVGVMLGRQVRALAVLG